MAVTGGRDFNCRESVARALAGLPADTVLVHGAATGADMLCDQHWRAAGGIVEPHPADWARHGRAAGPIRNQQMAQSGLDLLIAFPGGRGTADMTRRCAAAGIPVRQAAAAGPASATGCREKKLP